MVDHPEGLKDRLTDFNRAFIGVWSTLTDPVLARSFAESGFDALCIDEQHGNATTFETMGILSAISGAGTFTFVRVAWNRPELIGRALDSGADGVIVPMVQSAGEAMGAVRASKYAPQGQRSWGAGRVGYSMTGRQPAETNDRTVCFVMVETPEAIENVIEIAAVDGLDGLFVGPFDLSISYGLPVDALLQDESTDAPLARVVQACRTNGIVAAAYAGSLERAKVLALLGFSCIFVAADADLVTSAARTTHTTARKLLS